MIDRLMPLFAVIGVLSSIVYLTLAVWMVYENLPHVKKKHSAYEEKTLSVNGFPIPVSSSGRLKQTINLLPSLPAFSDGPTCRQPSSARSIIA